MTHRRRWLPYALISGLTSMLAIGVPLHGQIDDAAPVAFISTPKFAVKVPVPPSPVEAPAADAPAETSAPEPPPNPCADALAWVSTAAGLPLPDGVDYNCPSAQFSHHGAACWGNATYCPDRGFVAINMGLLEGTSTDYLRHVVAHEVCHILDFQATGVSTESGADACAAAHGAPA